MALSRERELRNRSSRRRYRQSAWAASSSDRFPRDKLMSDPGKYDPPSGLGATFCPNTKFPGGVIAPCAAFDSTSQRGPPRATVLPWLYTRAWLLTCCVC
jgi:hypothetical protein